MKRIYTTGCWTMMCLVWVLFLTGCRQISAYDHSPYVNYNVVEEARLSADENSPYCDFSMDYSCLNEEGDSIAMLINQSIHREFLGDDFASLTPALAVDSFKNTYLRNYRAEVGAMYKVDKERMEGEGEMPPWYGQTYSIVTFMEEGRSGIIGASANYFVDMGGAHPSQWSRWLNFDTITGQLLTIDDIFEPTSREEVERLLDEAVRNLQVDLYPDAKITIPDNFLLAPHSVRFLYNRYDIAPRSSGSIEVELSYEAIGHCLKR